jgi:hypothetical protein
MPIRNEKEALIRGIILQLHPIRQRPKIIPNMQLARRPHPAKHAPLFGFSAAQFFP